MDKLKIMLLLLAIGLNVANADEGVKIGQTYQGGIVFFVDVGGQHGLIAAKADQNGGAGIQWFNGTYFVTNATADGLYAGTENTGVIISTQTTVALACGETSPPAYCISPEPGFPSPPGNNAALVAANYSVLGDGVTACKGTPSEKCYGDWYLPSKYELNLMYSNIGQGAVGRNNNKGGFTNYAYWSSSEYDNITAWYQNFLNSFQLTANKIDPVWVRAVRAF